MTKCELRGYEKAYKEIIAMGNDRPNHGGNIRWADFKFMLEMRLKVVKKNEV